MLILMEKVLTTILITDLSSASSTTLINAQDATSGTPYISVHDLSAILNCHTHKLSNKLVDTFWSLMKKFMSSALIPTRATIAVWILHLQDSGAKTELIKQLRIQTPHAIAPSISSFTLAFLSLGGEISKLRSVSALLKTI